MEQTRIQQLAVCSRYRAEPVACPANHKLGVAQNIRTAELPINGLRHRPVGETTGWYIWAGGELSAAADFFEPLHVEHVGDWNPLVLPYLLLPPGFRFLIAPGYEDVWMDGAVLDPDE